MIVGIVIVRVIMNATEIEIIDERAVKDEARVVTVIAAVVPLEVEMIVDQHRQNSGAIYRAEVTHNHRQRIHHDQYKAIKIVWRNLVQTNKSSDCRPVLAVVILNSPAEWNGGRVKKYSNCRNWALN